jgi:hypothetical protein
MYNLEIAHKDLTGYKLFVGGELKEEGSCKGVVNFNVHPSDDTVEVWIEPWKIKPIVRVDNIMVNYALASISQFDHKLDIVLSSTFFDKYLEKDTKYRIEGIFGDKEPDPIVYDSVIGVGNPHYDLVELIRKELDD